MSHFGLKQEMEAYDILSPELRKFMRTRVGNYSAVSVLRGLESGVPLVVIKMGMLRADQQINEWCRQQVAKDS